jgi:hypothetical protein
LVRRGGLAGPSMMKCNKQVTRAFDTERSTSTNGKLRRLI